MEEKRKSPNDHGGNRKIVIKMGGGIGTVLLLGGALATAALASVFAVRHKRRSSGSQKSSSETNEKDEGNNEPCDEDEHISEGELENEMICDESSKLFVQDIVKEETPLLGENETAEDGEIEWTRHKEEKSDDEIDESKVDESVKEEIGNGEKALEGVGIEEEEEEEEENLDEAIEEKSVIVYQSETRMSEEVSKTSSVGEIEKESLVQLVVSEAKENFNANAAQLMSYEVGGKIQEDKVDGKGGRDDDSSRQRNRIIIWTVCVLSSLSCSCFFHLSLPKLCLLVFFTVFLLQIYGYPLLNRHHAHAQCLQAKPKPKPKPTNKLGNI